MNWNVKQELVWETTVPQYVITVSFDESEEKLKKTVAHHCVTMGYMNGWSPALNHFHTQPLPLSSKQALEEYLRGVRDGASEYRDRLNDLKRLINSFYGLPSETDTDNDISPMFEIKELIYKGDKRHPQDRIDSVVEDVVNLGIKNASLDDRVRVLERHDGYAANNIAELKHRTSLMDKDISKVIEIVDKTVDKNAELQQKVDELEAYIKALNPNYPLIINEGCPCKKKGWWKK